MELELTDPYPGWQTNLLLGRIGIVKWNPATEANPKAGNRNWNQIPVNYHNGD